MKNYLIAEHLGPLKSDDLNGLSLIGNEYIRTGDSTTWVAIKDFKIKGETNSLTFENLSSKPFDTLPPPPDKTKKRKSFISKALEIWELVQIPLKSKLGGWKLFLISLLYVVPGFNAMIVRGWRQDIINRVSNDSHTIVPDIVSYRQIGEYIVSGFRLLLYGVVYSIPLLFFLAIFGIEIVEIILEILIFEIFGRVSKYGNSTNEILTNGLTLKVIIEGIAIIVYTFTVKPLYRVAQIRSGTKLERSIFFNPTEIKRNYKILRKNKTAVSSTFITAIGFDILVLFGVVTVSTLTFGIGFFLFTPIIMVTLMYWPKAVSYGLLAKRLNESLHDTPNELFIHGKVSSGLSFEQIFNKKNVDFHVFDHNSNRWMGSDEFYSQHQEELEEFRTKKIVGDPKKWKEFRKYVSEKKQELFSLLSSDLNIVQLIFFTIIYYFAPFGQFYLRGWRLSIVQKYGGMKRDLDEPLKIFAHGFKLFIARTVYFIPIGIVLSFLGLQGIFLVFNILKWWWENFSEPSIAGFIGFVLGELSIRILIQLVVIGIYSFTIWPVYRISMIRYAYSERKSIRKEFLSFKRFKENFKVYWGNAQEVLAHYFIVVAVDIYIPVILSLIVLFTFGIGTLAFPLIIPVLSISMGYWFKGYIYGHLAHKLKLTG